MSCCNRELPFSGLSLTLTPQNEPSAPTIRSVYGKIPQVPDEYEVLGFRYPSNGDLVLKCSNYVVVVDWVGDGFDERGSPYLVLRRKCPDTTGMPWAHERQVVITSDVYSKDFLKQDIPAGWYGQSFRLLKDGEYYWAKDGSVAKFDAKKDLPFVALVLWQVGPIKQRVWQSVSYK